MTIEERIEALLPPKRRYTDRGKGEWYNLSREDCAINLKQAFERGEIAFVPSKYTIESILFKESTKNINKDGVKVSLIPYENFCIVAEEIISLLTKDKDDRLDGKWTKLTMMSLYYQQVRNFVLIAIF